MTIQVEKITKDRFENYGRVVLFPQGKPLAEEPEFKFWSDLAGYQIKGETEIGICTVYRQSPPEISTVERHLHTPEILIPIDAPFVLPLLLESDSAKDMRAFEVGIGEAVVIDAEVWHGASLPVGVEKSSYFVIFKRGTPANDVEKKAIAGVRVELET
jgi:ureidoglycolate hydrolase